MVCNRVYPSDDDFIATRREPGRRGLQPRLPAENLRLRQA